MSTPIKGFTLVDLPLNTAPEAPEHWGRERAACQDPDCYSSFYLIGNRDGSYRLKDISSGNICKIESFSNDLRRGKGTMKIRDVRGKVHTVFYPWNPEEKIEKVVDDSKIYLTLYTEEELKGMDGEGIWCNAL